MLGEHRQDDLYSPNSEEVLGGSVLIVGTIA
jgi:hypothetical protein